MDWDDGVTPSRPRPRGSLLSGSASGSASSVRGGGSVRTMGDDDEALPQEMVRHLSLRDDEPSVKGTSSVAGSQSGYRQHQRRPASTVRTESQSGSRHHRRPGSTMVTESHTPASEYRSHRSSVSSVAPDHRSRARSVAPSDSVSRRGEDDRRSLRSIVPEPGRQTTQRHDENGRVLQSHMSIVINPLTEIPGYKLKDVESYARSRTVSDARGSWEYEEESYVSARFRHR